MIANLDCYFFEIAVENATQIDAIVFVGICIVAAAIIKAFFNK